ncbi:SIR2 family protein [uncultured Treponema sp.]|uniref:SIR2 family NAD-dependent protein deacylase n=1 Tax=uncultured Treponema sp. TaxID=162155 RepID=UPI0025CF2FC4|nr:SIR2 family protein [uncultured Treponema sp.]
MTNQEIDIRNYINEIAEKIWSGHAAAMVGTGFSMNAKPKFETEKKIPLWNDLGLKFMEKLGMDTNNANCLFQDPIKLAGEVSANFGENTLNQILIDSIPDMDYEPSDLHKNFLKLNWTDVFTTNYDTLLERASEDIGVKHYSLVTKDYDLVNAIRPRIVKLHGSFPSTVPFIITEEQYRAYPKTHAAFVNTVQQALVENILVLFGFSGTDPNFLNWIGWIRDNLGTKLTNKIYLISLDSVSNAKLKLFTREISMLLTYLYSKILKRQIKVLYFHFS